MLAASILSETGLGVASPYSGLPIKTLYDSDIDGQLNSVYHKIRQYEKMPGHGPVNQESLSVWYSMMRNHWVDTIYYRLNPAQFLCQYKGNKYPPLKNRAFINNDINYIGFGEGWAARGLDSHTLNAGVIGHLAWDHETIPSGDTLAAAHVGYDWAFDKFFPSQHGPRHGSGN
jgi:hypothetical protein